MLGMVVSGGVSGGHINPAVTVAVATVGKFPWWKVGCKCMSLYMISSCTGSSLSGSSVPWIIFSLMRGLLCLLGCSGLVSLQSEHFSKQRVNKFMFATGTSMTVESFVLFQTRLRYSPLSQNPISLTPGEFLTSFLGQRFSSSVFVQLLIAGT